MFHPKPWYNILIIWKRVGSPLIFMIALYFITVYWLILTFCAIFFSSSAIKQRSQIELLGSRWSRVGGRSQSIYGRMGETGRRIASGVGIQQEGGREASWKICRLWISIGWWKCCWLIKSFRWGNVLDDGIWKWSWAIGCYSVIDEGK